MGAMQDMDRAEHDTRGSSNRVSRESRDGRRGGRRWFVGVEEESCRSRDLAMSPPYIVYLYLCDMSCREINPSFGRDPQAKPILNTPNLTPTTPPTPHSPAKRLRTTS